MRFRQPRIDRQRPAIFGGGGVRPALDRVEDAEVLVYAGGERRPAPQSLAVASFGLVQTSLHLQGRCKAAVHLGFVGLEGERTAVTRLGVGRTAQVEIGVAEIALGGGIGRLQNDGPAKQIGGDLAVAEL